MRSRAKKKIEGEKKENLEAERKCLTGLPCHKNCIPSNQIHLSETSHRRLISHMQTWIDTNNMSRQGREEGKDTEILTK